MLAGRAPGWLLVAGTTFLVGSLILTTAHGQDQAGSGAVVVEAQGLPVETAAKIAKVVEQDNLDKTEKVDEVEVAAKVAEAAAPVEQPVTSTTTNAADEEVTTTTSSEHFF